MAAAGQGSGVHAGQRRTCSDMPDVAAHPTGVSACDRGDTSCGNTAAKACCDLTAAVQLERPFQRISGHRSSAFAGQHRLTLRRMHAGFALDMRDKISMSAAALLALCIGFNVVSQGAHSAALIGCVAQVVRACTRSSCVPCPFLHAALSSSADVHFHGAASASLPLVAKSRCVPPTLVGWIGLTWCHMHAWPSDDA